MNVVYDLSYLTPKHTFMKSQRLSKRARDSFSSALWAVQRRRLVAANQPPSMVVPSGVVGRSPEWSFMIHVSLVYVYLTKFNVESFWVVQLYLSDLCLWSRNHWIPVTDTDDPGYQINNRNISNHVRLIFKFFHPGISMETREHVVWILLMIFFFSETFPLTYSGYPPLGGFDFVVLVLTDPA